MSKETEKLAARTAPAIFFVLWSTGFVATKYVLNNAEPLTYLAIRMAVVVGLMAVIVIFARPRWPDRVGIAPSAVAGIGDFGREPVLSGAGDDGADGLCAVWRASRWTGDRRDDRLRGGRVSGQPAHHGWPTGCLEKSPRRQCSALVRGLCRAKRQRLDFFAFFFFLAAFLPAFLADFFADDFLADFFAAFFFFATAFLAALFLAFFTAGVAAVFGGSAAGLIASGIGSLLTGFSSSMLSPRFYRRDNDSGILGAVKATTMSAQFARSLA